MSGHVSQTAASSHSDHSASPWGGGTSPYKVSYGKMMMWFFLISDAFTFSGLLTAYGFMRHKYEDIWPTAGDVFTHFPFYDGHIELAYVAFMTFVLIASSVTMVLAVEAGHSWRSDFRWFAGLGVVSFHPRNRARSLPIGRWRNRNATQD